MNGLDNQSIIKILGIEALPDEKKAKIVDDATELVQERLLVRVFDSLPEDKREGFTAVLDSDDEVALASFMNHNCPKFGEWMQEELTTLKQELAGLAKS